jgi:hypothetical protein
LFRRQIGSFIVWLYLNSPPNYESNNPNLLDLDIGVVTNVEQEKGGQWDGAVGVKFKSIQSVIIGDGMLLFWKDANSERKAMFPANLANWPNIAVFGPVPDSLKW